EQINTHSVSARIDSSPSNALVSLTNRRFQRTGANKHFRRGLQPSIRSDQRGVGETGPSRSICRHLDQRLGLTSLNHLARVCGRWSLSSEPNRSSAASSIVRSAPTIGSLLLPPSLRLRSTSFVLISLLFSAGTLQGQSTTASLTGRVTDFSKAVVPDARIIVVNTGTRIHYESITNETGSYYVTNLPPGTYRIEVDKLGFKAVIKSDLILHVQDALEVNFEMTLGSASESVTVRGGAPLLHTESATVGTVVEQRKANELPLNGRNVFNLIELAASVVPQGSSTGTPVGVNPFGWGNYQVNGSFGNESAEYLDGQPLNIGYINLPILIPTQDSIQEFKVQTSNLGPEWGRFSGGVTNLSTKAGTSSVHGEAYEYFRNRIFNANDFFLNAAGKARPPWVQNQFGTNAGGPLNLSHLTRRHKAFWF